VSWPFSWTCKYFDKGDVRYVAHDTARRGGASEEPLMAVLVHSGVPLGMKLNDEEELNDQNPKSKRKTLLENFLVIDTL